MAHGTVGASGLVWDPGAVNDFAPLEPDPAVRSLLLGEDDLVIRPALPGDRARVAQLLALRGHTAEEALDQAARTIGNVPVLLLALAGETPQVRDAHPVLEPPGRRQEPSQVRGAQPTSPPEDEAPDVMTPGDVALPPPGDETLVPVALAGAFQLPATALEVCGKEETDAPVWVVSGLVVDPDARRQGVGRRLLAAVLGTVEVLEPGAPVYSVVSATDHTSIALHMVLGFTQVARGPELAGITFEGGMGVLLRYPA